MVSFWSSSSVTQTAARLEQLRVAETQLMHFAQRYSETACSIRAFDTAIPRSCIPSLQPNKQEGDELTIHALHVHETANESNRNTNKSKYPLVALHGYYNGAAYYYRNLMGLASFYESVYSIDWLGWGLSSRPNYSYLKKKHSVESAEEWFVESLEAWRQANRIDKMVLLGHSMGGYMSVAYCERYPQHVHQLLLLSPVGVPDAHDPSFLERKERFTSTFRSRMFLGVVQTLFDWTTVGSVLRNYVSPERAYNMVNNYVERRLPQIEDREERDAVTDYLYANAVLPGSGEYAIHGILNHNILAKRPLQERIPQLRVKDVTFLYGQHDWMDMSGALTTQRLCEKADDDDGGGDATTKKSTTGSPNIQVYMVPNAGHLLMLENCRGTTAALIQAGGGGGPANVADAPVLIEPGTEALPDSQVRRVAMATHHHRQVYGSTQSSYPPPEVSME